MSDEERQSRQVAIGSYIAQALGDGAKAVVNVIQGGTDEARELRNRHNMLQLVWNTWIEGVLKQSLHNEVLIELGMETKPDALEHPWDMVVQMPEREPQAVVPGTTMLELFEQANGSLLILGEPGSGKTTMLLELCRLLIERAKEDTLQQIPVVFNLSSWTPDARKKSDKPFANWLINELQDRYFIPYRIGHNWIKNDALILLLDGLDEVEEESRETCIHAINASLTEYSMPLVICSRRQEYMALPTQLTIREAVLIQPLNDRQINLYLKTIGPDLMVVYKVVKQDPELQEFAQTPLILSILLLAYQNETEEDLRELKGAGGYRKRLFNTYIAKMFKRRAAEQLFSPEQTQAWLSWLALEMVERNQTLFTIEDVQPSWLPYSKGKRRLIFGLLYGLIYGLIGGLIFGLIGGVIGWVIGGQIDIKPIDKFVWSWKNARRLGLSFGLLGGLMGGVMGGLVVALIGALPRMGGVELIDVLIGGMIGGVIFGLIGGLSFGLIGGLGGFSMEERSSPAEGINASLKNFLAGTLFLGLFLGLVFGLVFGLINALINENLRLGLIGGLRFGLIVQLFTGMFFGGNFLITHYATRWLLYRSGYIPWKLIDFLDYCNERIFLRKVGGGYIYIHRMLMEHFAEMYKDMVESTLE